MTPSVLCCAKCKQVKMISEFYPSKTNSTGYRSRCVVCSAQDRKTNKRRHRAYVAAHYEKHKMAYILRARASALAAAGFTPESYQEAHERQAGVCAICKQPERDRKLLAADHCHVSNKPRGLLCRRCNTGIGLLQENPAILQAALAYLGAHHAD